MRSRNVRHLLLSCLVLSCLVLSCLVLSCLVLSCLVMSCLVLSYLHLSSLILSWLVLCCVVLTCFVLSCQEALNGPKWTACVYNAISWLEKDGRWSTIGSTAGGYRTRLIWHQWRHKSTALWMSTMTTSKWFARILLTTKGLQWAHRGFILPRKRSKSLNSSALLKRERVAPANTRKAGLTISKKKVESVQLCCLRTFERAGTTLPRSSYTFLAFRLPRNALPLHALPLQALSLRAFRSLP